MTHVGEQEVYGVERDRVGALFLAQQQESTDSDTDVDV